MSPISGAAKSAAVARFPRHFLKSGSCPTRFRTRLPPSGRGRWGVKKVHPDDNFFALGGHSLLGVKLIAEIQANTGMEEELRLSDLLEYPTLGAFTAHLESLDGAQRRIRQHLEL